MGAAKRHSNRRLLFAVLSLLLSTLGSIAIGLAILGTDYNKWDGVYAAKAQAPILVGTFFLRLVISTMIIGALLFGQFTGKDNGLCRCTCILAPLALILPLGAFVGALAVQNRDIESQISPDVPLEKEKETLLPVLLSSEAETK